MTLQTIGQLTIWSMCAFAAGLGIREMCRGFTDARRLDVLARKERSRLETHQRKNIHQFEENARRLALTRKDFQQ